MRRRKIKRVYDQGRRSILIPAWKPDNLSLFRGLNKDFAIRGLPTLKSVKWGEGKGKIDIIAWWEAMIAHLDNGFNLEELYNLTPAQLSEMVYGKDWLPELVAISPLCYIEKPQWGYYENVWGRDCFCFYDKKAKRAKMYDLTGVRLSHAYSQRQISRKVMMWGWGNIENMIKEFLQKH